jgi:hypothetical protein
LQLQCCRSGWNAVARMQALAVQVARNAVARNAVARCRAFAVQASRLDRSMVFVSWHFDILCNALAGQTWHATLLTQSHDAVQTMSA